MKILIINGPNLNFIGKRETNIYGEISFDDFLKQMQCQFTDLDINYYQTNIEGEIIDRLQLASSDSTQGIILNAGGYTHTSVAIRDAIASIHIPVVEVHISNTLAREEFRHQSFITPVCKGCIMGFGLESYTLALEYFRIAK